MRGLLFSPSFYGFFWTQYLGAFNDNLFKQSIVFMVSFQLARSLPKDQADFFVSLGAGIFILPFVLFSNWGAYWADEKGKSAVIRATKVLEIAIMACGSLAYGLLDLADPVPGIWLLLAVLFLMGTQSALFGPSKYGIIPEILPHSQLTMGNGLLEMGTFVAILLGTYLGGWLVDWFGNAPVKMGLFFLLIALLGYFFSRKIPPTARQNPNQPFPWCFPLQILRDLRQMKESSNLTLTILGISFFWFTGAIFLQLLPGYGVWVGASARQTNFMVILFSIGIGTGSLLCVPLSRFRIDLSLLLIGSLGMGLFCLDFGLFPPKQAQSWFDLTRPFIDLLFIGLFAGFYIVPLNAFLQYKTQPKDRARMMALNNILNALFMVSATALTLLLRNLLRYSEVEVLHCLGWVILSVTLLFAWQRPSLIYQSLSWLLYQIGQKRLTLTLPGQLRLLTGPRLSWSQRLDLQAAEETEIFFTSPQTPFSKAQARSADGAVIYIEEKEWIQQKTQRDWAQWAKAMRSGQLQLKQGKLEYHEEGQIPTKAMPTGKAPS